MENTPLIEIVEKIQKQRKDYDDYIRNVFHNITYIRNCYTFFPETNILNRILLKIGIKNWKSS